MKVRAVRREFADRHVELEGAALLEIGAMDTPTYPERDVRYLDWFSAEELRAMHAHNPRRAPDRIVDTDYVVKKKLFASEVSERFDLVIANHVIEHVADPLRWFEQLAELTKPGGNLLLAVPDRRYTFDYLRPVSTAADLLRAYAEDLERPSKWQMLESLFYHRPIRAEDAWGRSLESKLGLRRFRLDEALAHSARAEREYADVHCHVFTAASFQSLFESLAEGGFISWRVLEVGDVRKGSNEFLALFEAPHG